MTIKDIREQADLTRRQLCERFGIPYRTVQDWELGNRRCPDWVLRLIAEALNDNKRNM